MCSGTPKGLDCVSRPRPVSFLWLCLLALFLSSHRREKGRKKKRKGWRKGKKNEKLEWIQRIEKKILFGKRLLEADVENITHRDWMNFG